MDVIITTVIFVLLLFLVTKNLVAPFLADGATALTVGLRSVSSNATTFLASVAQYWASCC